MATLVLGAVGYALGASAGGLIGSVLGAAGAIIGSQVGGVIDREVFGLGGGRTAEGPRLGDLSVQSSAYGQAIPLAYGTTRLAGNVIWSTGLMESRHEETKKVKGGKGGGSTKVTNVTYTYSASFAVAISARPIAGIGRIWADGKLLRDGSGRLAVDGVLRIYGGGEDQTPDSLIEAKEGVGNAPAYRGLAYVVFEQLALAEYANRIPNLTFEVIADDGGDVALATVVADLAARAGLAAIDVSALSDTVSGFVIGRQMSYRQALELLAQAYRFDVVEVDGVLMFAPLDRASVVTIAHNDLVRPERGSDAAITVRGQEMELPREIALRYIDPARDFQVGVQRARRATTLSHVVQTRDLPLVLDASAAKRAAEIELALAWLRRETLAFGLPLRWLRLAPGDVITLNLANIAPLSLILDEVQMGGGRVRCRATPYGAAVLGSAATGDGGAVPAQIIPELAATVYFLLNLPSVSATDGAQSTFYAALSSAADGWHGAVLLRSVDGGASYEEIAASAAPATVGETVNALADGPCNYWDEANTLTVTLLNAGMTLESRPELAILNGANAALVGDEIIQFRNASLNVSGDWLLSGLLRGRRGTERHMTGHSAGERFILLEASAVLPIETTLGAMGREDLYKGVSVGALIEDVTATPFTYTAENLKPFAPVHASGVRDGAGNLTLSWIRRTRVGGDWLDGADVPLGEEAESYEVDIMNGSNVMRTLSASTAQAIYSAADQTADFGAPQSAVTVRIYQLSAVVGRGAALQATL